MDPQLWAAVVGAAIGAVLTALGAFMLWLLQERSATKRAVSEARVACAREIIRLRGNQFAVLGALNELPVLFYDNEQVIALYRRFLDGTNPTETLRDIVVVMAKVAGAKNLNTSDLDRVLLIPDVPIGVTKP